MYRYVVADVFTDTPLRGNPVAVVLDATGLSVEQMQLLARETHLSETTFVFPPSDGGDIRVRVFTPTVELPFAGHPLLGTAVVLAHEQACQTLGMETEQGLIRFTFRRDASGTIAATMDQPVPTWEPYEHAETLVSALGVTAVEPVLAYRNGPRHVLVRVADTAALSAIRPDLRVLATLPDMSAFCFAPANTHWRARMFSPAYGVEEDAATGSGAGALGVHLARHSVVRYGEEIEIRQGVEIGRLSSMFVTARGKGDQVSSVEVSGQAVIIARGEFLLKGAANGS
ncbi:PhzF family phenazine biosynthesis protein [Acrocarpospora catenulata]|uniref:PhzF family phenazine biosynthesis protein n=1 Tax=Acrocarpospora catenulata TaxID=2836182 RepID=UPI001BD98009|nr:PhzF family phenazine biosynthesis protein [Acrocarpospora catenulata]